MKQYPSYKDSGVEWVGEIPETWCLRKIKNIFWERKEVNNPIKTDNLISLTLDRGVIPHSEKGSGGNKPKDDISKYKIVYPGDIVVNSMNVIVGSVGLSQYYGLVSPVYYMLVLKELEDDIKFFHYLFRCEIFQKSLIGLGNGILIKHSDTSGKMNTVRMRIPMDKLNQQRIPYPSYQEQEQISNYLDDKTQQIDSLIEKTRQKIELLKEQRTALINQVVTKGLNPDAEMKDSGVKWFGEIPKGWNVRRVWSLGKFSKGRGIKKDEVKLNGVPCIRYGEIYTDYDRVVYSPKSFIDKETSQNSEPIKKGDILFTGSGELLEEIGKSVVYYGDTTVFVGGDIIILQLNDDSKPLFISYLMDSYTVNSQKTWLGKGGIIVHIYSKQLNEIKVTLPPFQEQQQIVDYLDKETAKIDSLIEKETKRIELLKEYRQALISEVVTGKVDVREEAVA